MKKITLSQRNKIANGKISGNGLHKLSGNGNRGPSKAEKTPADHQDHGKGFSVRLLQNGETKLAIQINADKFQHAKTVAPWLNPTQLERPAFLMNFPFSYRTECANNPWMVDMKGEKRAPNFTRASVQFLEVYRNIS